MNKRRYVCQGDPTTSRGVCISREPGFVKIEGRAIMLEGDFATCPSCGRQGVIVCHGPRHPRDKINDRHKILEGDLVVCGCSIPPMVIATQNLVSQTNDGQGDHGWEDASDQQCQVYDEQISFLTHEWHPVANVPYKLTLADGSVVEGRTDQQGKTERITTQDAQAITHAEFYPDTFYGCPCAADHMAEAGGRAPAPVVKVELNGIKTNTQAVGSSLVNHNLPPPDVRPMTSGEIAMARTVFKDAIDYNKVKIHNGGLFGIPSHTGNAMTPMGEIHFPSSQYEPDYSVRSSREKIWFIHEMGHVWQYQMGYSVVWGGIKIGLRGGYSDDHADPVSLPAYRYYLYGEDKGKTLPDFNMEQQADLIAHYFGADQLNMKDYLPDLPGLKYALASFLDNPKNPALLPRTTEIEPLPTISIPGTS